MVICAAKLDNSLHTHKRKCLGRVSKIARSPQAALAALANMRAASGYLLRRSSRVLR